MKRIPSQSNRIVRGFLAMCLVVFGLISQVHAENTTDQGIVMVVRLASDFPGDGIVVARPRFVKKPAVAPKKVAATVDLASANAETARLIAARAKVHKEYNDARIYFAQLHAFNGVEITKQACADAAFDAQSYFDGLSPEVQSMFGGHPPFVICTGGR